MDTPTFTVTTGTGSCSGRQKAIGKTVFVSITCAFTPAVTGTLATSLPVNSVSNAVISGKEIATSGSGAAGFVLAGSNSLSVLSAAGGQFTANGSNVVLTGSYESQ